MRNQTDLSNDLWVWVQLQQTPSKLCGSGITLGLGEDDQGISEGQFEMWWLKLAVSKVGGELQASTKVGGIGGNNFASLELHRDTQEILAGGRDNLLKLQ